MSDYARVDLDKLARLAEAGQLYQTSDEVIATALVPANFVFWSGSSKGIAVRLISVRISASAQSTPLLGTVLVDPAFTNGNPPVNLRLGSGSAQAFSEAVAAAAVSQNQRIAGVSIAPAAQVELLAPAGIYLPPNTGVYIITPIAAITYDVVWLWAECPPEESD